MKNDIIYHLWIIALNSNLDKTNQSLDWKYLNAASYNKPLSLDLSQYSEVCVIAYSVANQATYKIAVCTIPTIALDDSLAMYWGGGYANPTSNIQCCVALSNKQAINYGFWINGQDVAPSAHFMVWGRWSNKQLVNLQLSNINIFYRTATSSPSCY